MKPASNDTIASMMPNNFSPIDTEAVVGRLGDKGYLLAQIKISGGLVVAAFDFDQGDRVVLITKATLVAKNGSVDMQTR